MGVYYVAELSGRSSKVPWMLHLEMGGSTVGPGGEEADGLMAWWPSAVR